DTLGRQVQAGRLHAHHAAAGDVDGQGGDVVEVRVRDEPGRRAHEVPGLGAEGEADFQLGDAPVRLHRGARVALDGQAGVLTGENGRVFDHVTGAFGSGVRRARGGKPAVPQFHYRQRRTQNQAARFDPSAAWARWADRRGRVGPANAASQGK